jgi:dihydroxyacetone kinase-like predicted kinase
MVSPSSALLTIYRGEGVRDADAQALAARLQDTVESLEVELIFGGQPHYLYLISLE